MNGILFVIGALFLMAMLGFVVRAHRRTARLPPRRQVTRVWRDDFYQAGEQWLGCGLCSGEPCRRCADERRARRARGG
jgi:hypothetical protein